MIIIRGKSLTQKFNDDYIFKELNIEVKEGEIISLLGASGVGKTTLLNIIAGLEKPESGQVWLYDKDITSRNGYVGYMLQKDLLLPFKSTIDNICLPLQLKKISKQEQYEKARPYLKLFNLEDCETKYPYELSGGMKQRAAFLRTYLYNSKIMLLDEPFSALDTLTKKDIYIWFKKTCLQLKTSVLFITHDIDEALYLSNRIYLMKKDQPLKCLEITGNDSEDFLLTNEFLEYKRQIIDYLK